MVHLYHFAGLIFVDVWTHAHCVLYNWAYFMGLIFAVRHDHPRKPRKLDPSKVSRYTVLHSMHENYSLYTWSPDPSFLFDWGVWQVRPVRDRTLAFLSNESLTYARTHRNSFSWSLQQSEGTSDNPNVHKPQHTRTSSGRPILQSYSLEKLSLQGRIQWAQQSQLVLVKFKFGNINS